MLIWESQGCRMVQVLIFHLFSTRPTVVSCQLVRYWIFGRFRNLQHLPDQESKWSSRQNIIIRATWATVAIPNCLQVSKRNTSYLLNTVFNTATVIPWTLANLLVNGSFTRSFPHTPKKGVCFKCRMLSDCLEQNGANSKLLRLHCWVGIGEFVNFIFSQI